MDYNLNRFTELLNSKGLRLTEQRRSILELFIANKDRRIGIEEVFHELKGKKHSPGLSTVYRTIDLLVETGYVQKLYDKEGFARYQLEKQNSCTFICSDCGKTINMDERLGGQLGKAIKDSGIEIQQYKVNLYGSCQSCP